MANNDKNFNIPRGNDEYEAIRETLRQRIRDYEEVMPNQGIDHIVAEEQPKQIDWDKIQNSDQQNQASAFRSNVNKPANQKSMSFHQYQQNLNTEKKQDYFSGFEKQSSINQTSNSTPYAMQSHNSLNFRDVQEPLVSANHSKDPVVYKPKKRKSAGKTIVFLLILVAIIFGLSWVLREFVLQAYEIPSGSMEKTIMTGDMVFAEKVSYKFTSPKAGDIVTFNDPINDSRILIKRVIATEGQTVDIKNNKLYINGAEQKEDYVNNLPTIALRSSMVKYPYTVPEGQIWVMGDNRTNSQDSRYFGAVPVDSVIGQALVVYWPVSNAKNLG